MPKADIGRLALRSEGEFWNAYWAPSLTSMENAVSLGGVRLSLVQRSEEAKSLFMQAMQAAFSAVVEETAGTPPTWSASRAIVSGKDFRRFHNGLCIIHTATLAEIEPFGRATVNSIPRAKFYQDPIGYFIRADDETKAVIWAYVESQHPGELKESV